MKNDHSITSWLNELKGHHDTDAAQQIWNRFQKRLIGVAMRQLRGSVQRMADGEDVVNDAFASFYRRMESGQYPALVDRDGLWRLLLTMTENKARKQLRRELAQKRGAGNIRGNSVFMSASTSENNGGFERLASTEPTPEDAVCLQESLSELLDRLTDEERQVALLRMQAFANTEIAEQTGFSLATVERRLKHIREKWSDLVGN